MDGNSSWKNLIVSDRPWLVVLLTVSSSHLELFISRPTEDSPFLINTVAQGVLGRNRSLSVDGLLRSAKIWAWQRKYKPS